MKLRDYRRHMAKEGVAPVTWLEWKLGRIAGGMLAQASTLGFRRGDMKMLNHTLLALWVGNSTTNRSEVLNITALPPSEINAAIREGRMRIVIDEREEPSAA